SSPFHLPITGALPPPRNLSAITLPCRPHASSAPPHSRTAPTPVRRRSSALPPSRVPRALDAQANSYNGSRGVLSSGAEGDGGLKNDESQRRTSGGCSWCSTGRACTYRCRGRSSARRHPSPRPPPPPGAARRLTGRIHSIWACHYHIPRGN
uniref:Uncharacterized protein n=1 Tax=Aegilops tauschii subsp. strangulata TaxID=200361 RepID=A0A453NKR1_AEGTS